MNWMQLAALVAAGAATVASGGAAAPALAGAAGAGTAGAAGAAGAGAAGGLLGAGTAAGTTAGTGATGGLLGAAGSGAATTGAATAGAGGTTGATIGGLLGNPGTAASYGTGLGTQQTAMLAAQEAGMGSMPISGSLIGNATTAAKTAKPFMDAAGTGMQVANAMTPQEQPTTPPAVTAPVPGMTLQQLADQNQQNYTAPLLSAANARAARRQQRRGLLA